MNRYDSDLVKTLLDGNQTQWSDSPDDADVILVNTCCVREHAEERALGRLRQLTSLKRERPWVRVGILGCIAQELGNDLFDQVPDLDWVVGPDSYRKLPQLVSGNGSTQTMVDANPAESYDDIYPTNIIGPTAFLAIMRGCDNYCSYCIVPYVRGRERSRPLSSILEEVKVLTENNICEITFLGQNVNSYRDSSNDFPELLYAVSAIPELNRIRFLTSHPKDISERLIKALSDIPQICPMLHLPVQSGSNHILKEMNRKYTREEYLDKINLIREAVPEMAFSTDILVGYPGETERDFQDTLDLMEEVRYHSAFCFRYSVRPGTAAASLVDDVPEHVKISRLETVIDRQRAISHQWHQSRIGDTIEVLVESPAKKGDRFLMGKSPREEIVVFPGNGCQIGDIVPIKIDQVNGFTLVGSQKTT
jgi:tRNA-2-methylthio-N6-dimethylallyladenosine synthase